MWFFRKPDAALQRPTAEEFAEMRRQRAEREAATLAGAGLTLNGLAQHLSGGPKMVVRGFYGVLGEGPMSRDTSNDVLCEWFDQRGEITRRYLDVRTLRPA